MSNHRNKSVNVHQFAMVPRADIPRAKFKMQKAYKTTFDSGYLIPVFCEEVLPGDTYNVRATMFARLATPITPFMDNLHLESFFFFVPNRLTWNNWEKFMGQQNTPGDSISYTIPLIHSPNGGHAALSIYDYFGLPVAGQILGGQSYSHSALPLRAWGLIFNEWFRDQNLSNPYTVPLGDGPDPDTNYFLARRGKRHDYFTSALPWTQKGSPVTLPLGTTAPVIPNPTDPRPTYRRYPGGTALGWLSNVTGTGNAEFSGGGAATSGQVEIVGSGLITDLSSATAATINQIRQAFQIQKLLERDARGGTRYTEIVRSHFGVMSPDARLQRPEYLGGGSTPVHVNAVAQTSATTAEGTDTPQGNLSAYATATAHGHGFNYSATEHGYIIGVVNVRADLTYQQGLRRHWSRQTRYDFYFPVFAQLGEQPIYSQEIYCDGSGDDFQVFGYQERWAEYRYNPSEITGLFRSTTANNIDQWHLAQQFVARPVLNNAFILEFPPVDRVVAVGEEAAGQQFLMDIFYDMNLVRPMPLYSVPGLVDHF